MNVYTRKTDLVAAMIRELIVTGELSPRTPLRQRDLAARFGVSPTPVREALRRLESEGLVAGEAHRGATVAEPLEGAVEDNYRIRAALEPLAAEMAAARINEGQLLELKVLNEQLRRIPDGDRSYLELNARLHLGIYQAAGSPILASLIRSLWQSMPGGPAPARRHVDSARQHDQILEALRARDGKRAADVTREHILGALPAGTRADKRSRAKRSSTRHAPARTRGTQRAAAVV
jgi:DNA-binding GntR family transcriptional regulator